MNLKFFTLKSLVRFNVQNEEKREFLDYLVSDLCILIPITKQFGSVELEPRPLHCLCVKRTKHLSNHTLIFNIIIFVQIPLLLSVFLLLINDHVVQVWLTAVPCSMQATATNFISQTKCCSFSGFLGGAPDWQRATEARDGVWKVTPNQEPASAQSCQCTITQRSLPLSSISIWHQATLNVYHVYNQ